MRSQTCISTPNCHQSCEIIMFVWQKHVNVRYAKFIISFKNNLAFGFLIMVKSTWKHYNSKLLVQWNVQNKVHENITILHFLFNGMYRTKYMKTLQFYTSCSMECTEQSIWKHYNSTLLVQWNVKNKAKQISECQVKQKCVLYDT